MIDANPELRERAVIKFAMLQDLLQALLAERDVPEPQAEYLARLAVTVYEQALKQWMEEGVDKTFESCMTAAAAELEHALALCRPTGPEESIATYV